MTADAASIGARLRLERVAKGYESPGKAAEALGVVERTQRNYEADMSSPGAEYLARALDLGFDVGYVLSGRSSASGDIERECDAFASVVRKVWDALAQSGIQADGDTLARLCAVVHRMQWNDQPISDRALSDLIALASIRPKG